MGHKRVPSGFDSPGLLSNSSSFRLSSPGFFANGNNSTIAISPITNTTKHGFNGADRTLDLPSAYAPSRTNLSRRNGERDTGSQLDRLRVWRHDAMFQHQYETAAFIGDKILSVSGDANDAFWLAQVFYGLGQFTRAQGVLMRQDLLKSSVACRYLAALCLIKLSKWDEALALVGDQNPFRLSGKQSAPRNMDGGVRFEASLCYVRGLLFANRNNFDKAKESYKEALRLDIKCFEALEQLTKNTLLKPHEEWDFIDSLDFDGVDPEDVELVRSLYMTKLSKYERMPEGLSAETRLSEIYGLAGNTDLLSSRAERLFLQCRFQQCLDVCQSVLDTDQHKFSILPTYLACLHELDAKNMLFSVSHNLVDNYPDEPIAWLAIGVYYLATGRIPDARRHFSKASMMDPHFGVAWIGFAHTFALEGEHDQAITAYATAARLFQGTHLPQLFLGMQNLQLHNITVADEYLQMAFHTCPSDPLLLNEMGAVQYYKNQHREACRLLENSLEKAIENSFNPLALISIRSNLGHAYRKLRRFDDALACFQEVSQSDPRNHAAYTSIGLVEMQMGRKMDAVVHFHNALGLARSDPIATELLSKALQESGDETTLESTIDEIDFDDIGPPQQRNRQSISYDESEESYMDIAHPV